MPFNLVTFRQDLAKVFIQLNSLSCFVVPCLQFFYLTKQNIAGPLDNNKMVIGHCEDTS